MTTRKLAAAAGLATALCGCATPGPLHLYTVGDPTAARIDDAGPPAPAAVPSFLAAGETLTGFAYDPFTDHFFLRLAPGNRIRVVDRPARKIKREFTVAALPATGGGDLAIRPRDGHVFFLQPGSAEVVETSRLGAFVRRFPLRGVAAPIGLACDARADRLLALHAGGRVVTTHALDGTVVDSITLARAAAGPLACDAERGELYAPLAGAAAIGIFDRGGALLRETPSGGAAFVDVGIRSFVRVF